MFKKEVWFISETPTNITLIHEKITEFEFSFNKTLKEEDLLKLLPIFQRFYDLGKEAGIKETQSKIKTLLGL